MELFRLKRFFRVKVAHRGGGCPILADIQGQPEWGSEHD